MRERLFPSSSSPGGTLPAQQTAGKVFFPFLLSVRPRRVILLEGPNVLAKRIKLRPVSPDDWRRMK